MSGLELHAGFVSLSRRLALREARKRSLRLALVATMVVFTALMAGIWVGHILGNQPLHYSLMGAQLGESGSIRTGPDAGILQFSDGSLIQLHPETRARLVATTATGARLRLADGAANVTVTYRPETSWEFDAGPYSVFVRGTQFFIRWAENSQELELRMISGSTAVEGPLLGEGMALRAGQTLRVDQSKGTVSVQ